MRPRTMAGADAARASRADVLVIFGISGDLARVMTFRSLYRSNAEGCSTARSSASRWRTGAGNS